jgi:hypothetical protein
VKTSQGKRKSLTVLLNVLGYWNIKPCPPSICTSLAPGIRSAIKAELAGTTNTSSVPTMKGRMTYVT